jgi:hypothetical protein
VARNKISVKNVSLVLRKSKRGVVSGGIFVMRRILMKKICFLSVLFALFCFSAFCETNEEEMDFLLFLPESSNQFVDEERAVRQLDNLSVYLKGCSLVPGQIHVYGYSAAFANDTDATDISRDRAIFVINELEKRGVSRDFFSDPVGYGEVDLWGGNTDEYDRSPNRRVRILLDGSFLTPAEIQAVEPAVQISAIDEEEVPQKVAEEEITQRTVAGKPCSIFPWILLPLLLLLLLALLLFLLLRKNKKTVTIVNLDEEIIYCAYMLYLRRNGQNENAFEDWYNAVIIICTKYEDNGYDTYMENWSWWARKTNEQ